MVQMPDFFCVTTPGEKRPDYGVIHGQSAYDIIRALAGGNKLISRDNILLAGFTREINEQVPLQWRIDDLAAKFTRVSLGGLELVAVHSQFRTCQPFPSTSVDKETGERLSDAEYWAAEGCLLGQLLRGENHRDGFDYAFTSYHYHLIIDEDPGENVEIVIVLRGEAILEMTDVLGGNRRTILMGQRYGIPVFVIPPGNGHLLAVKKGGPDFVSLLVTSKTIVEGQSINARESHIPIDISPQELFPYLVAAKG